MSTVTPFEMKIVDIFEFSDGRTVIVGPIEGEVRFIRPCMGELMVNGVAQSIIQVEGEMIPNRVSPEGYRSVSTREAVPLDRQWLSTAECLLRPVSCTAGAVAGGHSEPWRSHG